MRTRTRAALASLTTLAALAGAAGVTTLAELAGTTPAAAAADPAAAPAAAKPGGDPAPTTATVPVEVMGPDTVVGVVRRGSFEPTDRKRPRRTLVVVEADGTRHDVYSVRARFDNQYWIRGDFTLVDWQPATYTALLRVYGANGRSTAVSYNVTTGESHSLRLRGSDASLGLSPDGTGVVVSAYPSGARRGGEMSTVSWAGDRARLAGRSDFPSLGSPDGTLLVSSESTRERWWVADIATRTATSFDTGQSCIPQRWYDATSVVATCFNRWGSQLKRIGPDGSREPLGMRHRTGKRDYHGKVWDDTDVRTVQGVDWYESNGPCGGSFVSDQRSGKAKVVKMPSAKAGISLLGVRDDRLLVAHTDDCGDEGVTRSWLHGKLSLFDPVTREEDVLLRLRRGERWDRVQSASEYHSWGW